MSSISTRRGDDGQMSSPGRASLSKAELRVEAVGNIDELTSVLGIAPADRDDPKLEGRKEVPSITHTHLERPWSRAW